MTVWEFIVDNREWLIQSYSQGVLLSFVAFLCYVELSPKMGGIVVRPGPDGKLHFNLSGLAPLMKNPFQSLQLWSPCFWDLNFIIFTQFGAGIYMSGKGLLQKG